MTFQSRNLASVEESLQLQITAMKSLLSEYALRTKQAEEVAGMLMRQKLDANGVVTLSQVIVQHIDAKAQERVVHQQAVLQDLLIAMQRALELEDESLRPAVNKIYATMALSMGHMNEVQQQPSR